LPGAVKRKGIPFNCPREANIFSNMMHSRKNTYEITFLVENHFSASSSGLVAYIFPKIKHIEGYIVCECILVY
jgi:hypothetical protein